MALNLEPETLHFAGDRAMFSRDHHGSVDFPNVSHDVLHGSIKALIILVNRSFRSIAPGVVLLPKQIKAPVHPSAHLLKQVVLPFHDCSGKDVLGWEWTTVLGFGVVVCSRGWERKCSGRWECSCFGHRCLQLRYHR